MASATALAIAEWLRIAYGRKGLRVSCLCPQSVQTDMTREGTGSAGVNGVLTPSDASVMRRAMASNFRYTPPESDDPSTTQTAPGVAASRNTTSISDG